MVGSTPSNVSAETVRALYIVTHVRLKCPAMIYFWDWLPLKLIVISYYPPHMPFFFSCTYTIFILCLRTSPSHEVNHYYIHFTYRSSYISIFFPSIFGSTIQCESIVPIYIYFPISPFHPFKFTSTHTFRYHSLPLATRTQLDPLTFYFTSILSPGDYKNGLAINRPTLLFRTRIVCIVISGI